MSQLSHVTLEQQLNQLEFQLQRLCNERRRIVEDAEQAIKIANRNFDKIAVPLGRKINKLREKIDAEQQPIIETPKTPKASTNGKGSYDPEWSQEDIDHYRELVQRGR